jgi:hypothetical protein
LLSIVPLELREMPQQGLSPLSSNVREILVHDASVGYFSAAHTLLQNVFFGVPLAGYVENAVSIPKDYLLTSINPLPSFVSVAGLPPWDDIRDQLRVTNDIPFSALGELLNHGWLWLISYYAAVGLVAAWADTNARAFEGQRSRWGFLVACGMLDSFAIISTQYNLRSATRFIYYAIFLAVAWRAFYRMRGATRFKRIPRSGEIHTDGHVLGHR